MSASPTQIVLRPFGLAPEAGSPSPLALGPDGVVEVGRSSGADWLIADPGVSRRHARIASRGGVHTIRDLGSRHGTSVNGRRLEPGEPVEIRAGDVIAFGVWRCRAEDPRFEPTRHTVLDHADSRVEVLRRGTFGGVAQLRLDAVLGATRRLVAAGDIEGIASELARSASAGTGCRRTLVLRLAGAEACEVLASADGAAEAPVSLSALRGALEGEVIRLGEGVPEGPGQSITELKIRTVICAPVMVNGAPDCFLYLDTRGDEGTLPEDCAAFCAALADLGGLAIERLQAAEMEERRLLLERDLAAARRSQELLLPARSGAFRGLRYAFELVPGRHIAGDLFDVVGLPDGRTAFFLGDVSGKGAGAGVLMAATQAHLRTLLMTGAGLGEAIGELNAHMCRHTEAGRFLTLIAGIWHTDAGELEITDAGHGLCVLRRGAEPPSLATIEGGFPIGVTDEARFGVSRLPLADGSRVTLFSDGVIEQRDGDGRELGRDAAMSAIAACSGVNEDVGAVMALLGAHAGGSFADDVTVASIEFRRA